jgi:hypothetical protein
MVINGNLKTKKMITENTTIREFLQTLGTECLRDNLSKNIWAAALFADYTPTHYLIGAFDTKLTDGEPVYPNWIITDMRFENELEAIVRRKGITIRVVRPCSECGGTGYHKISCSKQYQKEHPSETSLDDAEFNYEIINDAGIPELIEKVRQILITEKII